MLQIILGIFVPFTIIHLDFKSKEELQCLPQTVEEHINELEEGDESSSYSDSEPHLERIDTNGIIEVNSPMGVVSSDIFTPVFVHLYIGD